MRESGQVAGGALSPRDQREYVRMLVAGGISRIEIGFPGSSSDQLRQCREIAEYARSLPNSKEVLLGGLARAKEGDILAVHQAGLDTCHIYTPTSDAFIRAMFSGDKYGGTEKDKKYWILQNAVDMVRYAQSLGFVSIEYSPEDAARTDREFLYRLLLAVIDAGATVVNIPDTTGLRIGDEFGELITDIRKNVANIGQAKISVHCHNDSDHSTHNALQAILAGADIVEGTFYGLGERSGMTKFEAVIMNIQTRPDVFGGIFFHFDSKKCYEIVNFVANALGMPVPRHWVVVGEQNGTVSSGTHQAVESRSQGNGGYYSWDPSLYGHGAVKVAITQSSGRNGLAAKLQEMGYRLSLAQISAVYDRIVRTTTAKAGKALSDPEIAAIVQEEVVDLARRIVVEACQAVGGRGTTPMATTIVVMPNGEKLTASATAGGQYDAVMQSIKLAIAQAYKKMHHVELRLETWNIGAITSGQDALADVYVRIVIKDADKEQYFVGRAVDADTTQAVAQAFANAIAWYAIKNKETGNE